ncbi:hypothetical protein HPB52_012643 [Rhipicephalus sanguineus]|uniref:RING-type domain-containing protein n=1 Tax=Rhipicephalus sanguineus TaxID=34632 RepID=A0A9D4SSH6_RHISA|nr:hypothetical protein HPB52_012643 [Rhipicephalus sanguineus]
MLPSSEQGYQEWVESEEKNQKLRRPLQGKRTGTPFEHTSQDANCAMTGTTWEYMLTGFGAFYERRRLVFLEPMPASLVCSVCDMVCSLTVNLLCGHVFCQICKKKIASKQRCPIDGIRFGADDVKGTYFSLRNLEKRRALCGVGGTKCGFVGALSDVSQHMNNCDVDEYKCPNCDGLVFRRDAVDHYQQCYGGNSVAGSMVPSTVLENPRVIDKDAEAQEGQASSESTTEKSTDAPVSSSLMEKMAEHEGEAPRMGNGTEGQDHRSARQGSPKAPNAAGPYRAASKPGVSIAMCVFKGVPVEASLLKDDEMDLNITSDQCTLAGYTFRVRCHFLGNERLGARIHFVFFLESGEWDDNVVWPFAKKVTLVLSHPLDAEMDIRLPLTVAESADTARKPHPIVPNNGYKTRNMQWDCILQNGYVGKKKLYVNVEME